MAHFSLSGRVFLAAIILVFLSVAVFAAAAPVNAQGRFAPSVSLLRPLANAESSSRRVVFSFFVANAPQVSRCDLLVNGVSQASTAHVFNGINIFSKSFASDALINWQVSCSEKKSGKAYTSPIRVLNINASPYQITTCMELQGMDKNLSGKYTLMNDINCSDTKNWNGGAGFLSIGGAFTGSLNGNYHSISGLYLHGDSGIGLFGSISSGAVVSDLHLKNIFAFESCDGGLAGSNFGTITNVSVDGTVNCYYNNSAGGLVGSNSGTISNSSFSGGVGGNNYVGGLAGTNSGTISDSYSAGGVGADSDYAGGLVGVNDGVILRSYSTADVSGDYEVGGLVGRLGDNGTISYSFATGKLSTHEPDWEMAGYPASPTNGVIGWTSNGVADPNVNFAYWDINRSGQINCSDWGPDDPGWCFGKNATGFDANYWFVPSNAPQNSWDFNSVWSAQSGTYPVLKWQAK